MSSPLIIPKPYRPAPSPFPWLAVLSIACAVTTFLALARWRSDERDQDEMARLYAEAMAARNRLASLDGLECDAAREERDILRKADHRSRRRFGCAAADLGRRLDPARFKAARKAIEQPPGG